MRDISSYYVFLFSVKFHKFASVVYELLMGPNCRHGLTFDLMEASNLNIAT